jgi:hypothetical protein
MSLMRSVPRLHNEEQLRLRDSCETVVSQQVRENGSCGNYEIGSRYQATTDEDTEDCGDFVRGVMSCRFCELALGIWLFVDSFCKN